MQAVTTAILQHEQEFDPQIRSATRQPFEKAAGDRNGTAGNRLVAELIVDALTPMPTIPEDPSVPLGAGAAIVAAGAARPVQEVFAFDFARQTMEIANTSGGIVTLQPETAFFSNDRWHRLAAVGGESEHYFGLGQWPIPAGLVSLVLEAEADGTCMLRTQLLNENNHGVLADFDLCRAERASTRLGTVTNLSSAAEELDDGWMRLRATVRMPEGTLRSLIQLRNEEGGNVFAPADEAVRLRRVRITVVPDTET